MGPGSLDLRRGGWCPPRFGQNTCLDWTVLHGPGLPPFWRGDTETLVYVCSPEPAAQEADNVSSPVVEDFRRLRADLVKQGMFDASAAYYVYKARDA